MLLFGHVFGLVTCFFFITHVGDTGVSLLPDDDANRGCSELDITGEDCESGPFPHRILRASVCCSLLCSYLPCDVYFVAVLCRTHFFCLKTWFCKYVDSLFFCYPSTTQEILSAMIMLKGMNLTISMASDLPWTEITLNQQVRSPLNILVV